MHIDIEIVQALPTSVIWINIQQNLISALISLYLQTDNLEDKSTKMHFEQGLRATKAYILSKPTSHADQIKR